jgi:hypothetical protein
MLLLIAPGSIAGSVPARDPRILGVYAERLGHFAPGVATSIRQNGSRPISARFNSELSFFAQPVFPAAVHDVLETASKLSWS